MTAKKKPVKKKVVVRVICELDFVQPYPTATFAKAVDAIKAAIDVAAVKKAGVKVVEFGCTSLPE